MPIIEVENLRREFGRFVAVNNVSFTVGEGEVFGLLGPNGAGKSTTIRVLCTLLLPTAGQARVDGVDVVREPARVRRAIGLVAERLILYDRLTAAENLRLFGRLNHLPDDLIATRTEYWLERLQMQEWEDHLVGTFSTGMKQRINIARALLHMPRVAFLDEPTLGLDPQTTRSIREFILELKAQGLTVILTTHMMVEAEMLCDRVGIIDHGRVVALDTPANLKRLVSNGEQTVAELEAAGLSVAVVADLEGRPEVASLAQIGDRGLRLHIRGEDPLAAVLEVLRHHGVRLTRLHTVEPTLEDVFLQLTGREMRDEAGETISRRRHRRRPASNTRGQH